MSGEPVNLTDPCRNDKSASNRECGENRDQVPEIQVQVSTQNQRKVEESWSENRRERAVTQKWQREHEEDEREVRSICGAVTLRREPLGRHKPCDEIERLANRDKRLQGGRIEAGGYTVSAV